jgi:RNase P subunit RPR2
MVQVSKIHIGRAGHLNPLCPHCQAELNCLANHKGRVDNNRELLVLSCPHCRVVLNIQAIRII